MHVQLVSDTNAVKIMLPAGAGMFQPGAATPVEVDIPAGELARCRKLQGEGQRYSDATFANRNGRVFGRAGDRLRGRYATPAEFTRHDVKVWDVHRSRTIFCRPALNPRVTIRNSFASLYADKRRPVGLTRGGTLQTWAPSGSCAWRWWALGAGHTQCKNSHTLPIHPYIRGMPGPVGGIMVMPVCVMQTWAPSGSCAWRWWARRSPGRWARCACWSSPRAPRTRSRVTTRCRPSSRSCA